MDAWRVKAGLQEMTMRRSRTGQRQGASTSAAPRSCKLPVDTALRTTQGFPLSNRVKRVRQQG